MLKIYLFRDLINAKMYEKSNGNLKIKFNFYAFYKKSFENIYFGLKIRINVTVLD